MTGRDYEEIYKLKYFKGVSCIIMILLYCSFLGVLRGFIDCFIRFPVLFFMVSGYLVSNRIRQWFKKKTRYILILIFTSEFLARWRILFGPL